jgi:exodeoxyribonuclease V alpha subunit
MSEILAQRLSGLLKNMEPKAGAELEAAVAALFRGLSEGHVCLDGSISDKLDAWLPALRKLDSVVGSPGEYKPLIADGGRLYLTRYWKYETDVAAALRRLAGSVNALPDEARLGECLARVFAGEDPDPHQLAAVRGAVLRNLTIISGGPGTGKTTAVAKILAVRQMLAPEGKLLTIRLAAPTGKAADRLRESVAAVKRGLALPEAVKALIPEEASTLHRLLGINRSSGAAGRDRTRQLRLDLLVIDEASMIDLSMMAKVLDALPPGAALILLGDRDQLDAVQPGSVFGDLCRTEGSGALRDSLFTLTRSHRFETSSGIGSLAKAVNAGDEVAALSILRGDRSGQITWIETDRPDEDGRLVDQVLAWLRPYFHLVGGGASAADCFEAFGRFRLLTPLREGPGDVGTMNARITEWLRRDGVDVADWYPGRPLLVTVNNYTLRLFNGDVGIALKDDKGRLAVAFPGEGDTWRRFAPARLPSHEPAFAFTVHKSQGSEFDTVLLLVPPGDNPVVSRNLLYTAITRAKSRCMIWGSEAALRQAIARKPLRASGLWDRLR